MDATSDALVWHYSDTLLDRREARADQPLAAAGVLLDPMRGSGRERARPPGDLAVGFKRLDEPGGLGEALGSPFPRQRDENRAVRSGLGVRHGHPPRFQGR